MRSSGTTVGATAECVGVIAAFAKSVSADAVFASAGAVCNFYWSCFYKTAFAGATVGIFG